MDPIVKVAGLVSAAGICMVSLILGEMDFAYTSGGIFAAILGLPIVGQGIRKLAKS